MNLFFFIFILVSYFIISMKPNIDKQYKIIWYSWFGKRKWFKYGY